MEPDPLLDASNEINSRELGLSSSTTVEVPEDGEVVPEDGVVVLDHDEAIERNEDAER